MKQYAPFTYDAAGLLIAAMQKANSTDPAKYLSSLASITYDGASGHIEFDAKGDRKDAEMTIFEMKDGKVQPIAIIKAGKTTRVGGAAAAAPAAAPATEAPKKTAPKNISSTTPVGSGIHDNESFPL